MTSPSRAIAKRVAHSYLEQMLAEAEEDLRIAKGRRIKGEVEKVRRRIVMWTARLAAETPARRAA